MSGLRPFKEDFMKTHQQGLLALGLGAALLFSAPPLRADEAGDKGQPPKDAPGLAEQGEHPGGQHGDMMKKKLDLSDEQDQKMKEAHKANQAAMKPLKEKLKIDVDTLRLLVDKKASDSELSKALDELHKDRLAMQALQEKHIAELKAILNPMQQAKLAVSMAGMIEHGMMGGMMEGHGHEGWGREGGDKPEGM
jgi:Spy/CpxP family protein refolding chaperone